MNRSFLLLGSSNALLAVALGAFGAHGLRHLLTDTALQTWNTAAQYHFYHALALLLLGLLCRDYPAVKTAGWLLFAGVVLFCGSLYALAWSRMTWLGMITPLGGVCFLLGWLWLIKTFWRKPDE